MEEENQFSSNRKNENHSNLLVHQSRRIPGSMSSSFDALLKCYDTSYKRLKRNFIRCKEHLLADPSLQQCRSAIRLIDDMAKIIFFRRRCLMSERNNIDDRLAELCGKITNKQKKANGNRHKSLKKKRKLTSHFDYKHFRPSPNYQHSLYFCFNNDYHEHENIDYLEILADGHRVFGRVSCDRPPWTLADGRKMRDGIRECVRQKFLRELQTIQRESELNPVADQHQTAERYTSLKNLVRNFDSYNYKELMQQAKLADDDYDWKFISSVYLKGKHTAEEIEKVWQLIANPTISCKCWTTEEDMMLRSIATECRYQNWTKINSQLQTGRTEFQCFVRYQRHLKSPTRISSNRWLNKQDAQVKELGKRISIDRVTDAKTLNEHSSIFIKKIGKMTGRFSYREKCLIHSYVKRGYSFDSIARLLGGNRNSDQIRVFYRNLTSKTKHGNWHPDEIRRLLKCVKYMGERRWIDISRCMFGRSATQCCHKYHLLRLKRNGYVQNFLERRAPFNRMKEIRQLLRSCSRDGGKSTKRRQKVIDLRIEQYFLERFAQQSTGLPTSTSCINKELCIKHSLSLLKFLNFDVNSTRLNFNVLYDYLKKRLYTKENCETFDEYIKAPSTVDCKMLDFRTYSAFTKIVPKRYNVLPPNECCIYGFNKFMKNYELFVQTNEAIDFDVLWQRLNLTYNCDKEFIQAKILWYSILKAMFFWPVKLKSLSPEELPKMKI